MEAWNYHYNYFCFRYKPSVAFSLPMLFFFPYSARNADPIIFLKNRAIPQRTHQRRTISSYPRTTPTWKITTTIFRTPNPTGMTEVRATPVGAEGAGPPKNRAGKRRGRSLRPPPQETLNRRAQAATMMTTTAKTTRWKMARKPRIMTRIQTGMGQTPRDRAAATAVAERGGASLPHPLRTVLAPRAALDQMAKVEVVAVVPAPVDLRRG